MLWRNYRQARARCALTPAAALQVGKPGVDAVVDGKTRKNDKPVVRKDA